MKQIIQVENNTKLRILTGRRWTSWLFHKCCWGLWSWEYRGTNPASGQGRTWSQGLQITSPVPLTAWPHCLLLKAFWKCQTQTILAWLVCFQIKCLTKHLPVQTQFKDINRFPAHIYLDLPKVNLMSDLTSFWVSRASFLGVLVSSLLRSFCLP